MNTVIFLDSEERHLENLKNVILKAAADYSAEIVFKCSTLLKRIDSDGSIEMIIVDYFKGDGEINGGDIIRRIRSIDAQIPIVAVADKGNVEIVAEAVNAGATTFLVLGEKLEERVKTLLGKMHNLSGLIQDNRILKNQNQHLQEIAVNQNQIIGCSPQIQELLRRIKRVAKIPRPVLVIGERGTGKELIARMIHQEGSSEFTPLISVNCAAFSESLLESELFGHERGSFTGADRLVKGKFELADGGALFLDEIGAMSLSFQHKILRVVEYGRIMRVGGSSEIKVNMRIIAATNSNLEEKMANGEFLRDLYDRLSFEVIYVPPLRERAGDVDILAQYFLNRFMLEIPGFRGKRLSAEALEILRQYKFPGNVRELKNIIERAAYRDTTTEINPEDIDLPVSRDFSAEKIPGNFEEKVAAYKRKLIKDALEKAQYNQAQAARILGITYHQFRYYYQTLNK